MTYLNEYIEVAWMETVAMETLKLFFAPVGFWLSKMTWLRFEVIVLLVSSAEKISWYLVH